MKKIQSHISLDTNLIFYYLHIQIKLSSFVKLVTLTMAMAFLYEINDNLADGVRTVDKNEKNIACDKD